MRLITLLAVITIVKSAVIPNQCDGVTIDGIYHAKEILEENYDRPYLLSVDHSTDTLYYSYSTDSIEDDFQSSYINLNTKEVKNIDLQNGFSQTVDPKTHEVFIGNENGIYKFDPKTKAIEPYAAQGINIWLLYFKDYLYFTNFPGQFLYVVKNGEVERFKPLEDTKVIHFLIDNDEDILFFNDTGFYEQKKGTKDAILYKENHQIRALTSDVTGKAFMCADNGIYAVDKTNKGFIKIVDLYDGFGLAFDSNNNIIYANATSLVRLQPKDGTCEETSPTEKTLTEENDS